MMPRRVPACLTAIAFAATGVVTTACDGDDDVDPPADVDESIDPPIDEGPMVTEPGGAGAPAGTDSP